MVEPDGINSSIEMCKGMIAAGQHFERYEKYLQDLLEAKAQLHMEVTRPAPPEGDVEHGLIILSFLFPASVIMQRESLPVSRKLSTSASGT
jgi:hypothetical protein